MSAPRRPVRRTRALAASSTLLVLSLAACGGGDTSALDTRAHWTQASLPKSAAMSGPDVSFAAVLGASTGQPALVAGTGADAGATDTARVWTDQDGSWRWRELPLPAKQDSAASLAVSDGTTTWVAGTTWRAGERVTPFLVRSKNRLSWTSVALPGAATDAAVVPQAAAALDGGLLVVGADAAHHPVAVITGTHEDVVALPAVPGGRVLGGFDGVAVHGRTAVAVAHASAGGQTDESVVYRSTDAGQHWSVDLGPAQGPTRPSGVAVEGDSFVVTGRTSNPNGSTAAAAWSSPDGATWTGEVLPTLDADRDGLAPRGVDDVWLSAPSAAGGRLVAPISVTHSLRFAVLQRDAAGTWSVLGTADNWVLPGESALAGLAADGSVQLAQSDRNVGRVGTVSAGGQWIADPAEFGTEDRGIFWNSFLDPTATTPALMGYRSVVSTTFRGGWTQSNELSGYALSGSRVTERPWEPAESAQLKSLFSAGDPSGASVVLGAQIVDEDQDDARVNVTGWFRASAQAGWTPVTGLDTPRSQQLADVRRVGGTWVAVGTDRPSFAGTDGYDQAAVWTSTDGVSWTQENGPFSAAGGGSANSACALAGGDLLVVGSVTENAQQRPVVWRRSGGQWSRLPASALGDAYGSLSTCTTMGKTTLVQGTSGGRDTVWRTTDGTSFAGSSLGATGDSFGPIRVVDGGFAAAGSRGSDGQQGAVVWLSKDAAHWRAVPVPSSRRLTGVDVMAYGKKLVLAADSTTAPQIWVLDDPATLLAAG